MNKKNGFTLAEVLITLAIIGVVAVLTIPTLVANYQQRGWNTAATVFERKLEESLKIMNTQGTLAGYKTTEAFVSELQKHLKITKVCKNDDILSCFEDKVMWGSGEAEPEEVDMSTIKTSSHFGQSDWKTNVLGLQLANGTSALIAYNPECKQDPYSNQVAGTSCVAVLYDTSGFTKPNTSGKDLRGINVKSLGGKCALEINGTCYGASFSPAALTKAECEAQKSKLGIAECCDYCDSQGGDFWAGAAKACGSVNNLPSRAQLAEIASYLYGTNITGLEFGTQDEADLIESKLSDLNLTNNADLGGVALWSKEETFSIEGESDSPYPYVRVFYPNGTAPYYYGRNGSEITAICVN